MVMEDDVVDLVGEADLSIGSDEVEIVHEEDDVTDLSGRDSRRARREKRSSEGVELQGVEDSSTIETVLEIPIPDSPLMPPVAGQVTCQGCQSRFATEPGTISMKCPVCGTKIGL